MKHWGNLAAVCLKRQVPCWSTVSHETNLTITDFLLVYLSEKYDYVGRLLKPGEEPSEYTDEEDTKDHSKQDWTLWTTKARGLQNYSSYSFQRTSSLGWRTCCEKHLARVYPITSFTVEIWIGALFVLPDEFVAVVCDVWWASSPWQGDRALTARKSPGYFHPSPSLFSLPSLSLFLFPLPLSAFLSPTPFKTTKKYQRQPDRYLLLKCIDLWKQQGILFHRLFYLC